MYQVKDGFTCQAQTNTFLQLLRQMASRAQDYITPQGRMTTNSVEGFHGLCLMYRDKRTDLEHIHYTCKTNMAICHKVNSFIAHTIQLQFCVFLLPEHWPNMESAVLF